jgi:hypothetical protein
MRLETQELREQVRALAAEMRASPGPAVKDGYVANTFHEGLIPQDYATRSRAPNDPREKHDTRPVTAVGFASIDVEIRTELEKGVLHAL